MVFGTEHSQTAILYNNIGSAHDNLGNYDKAPEYFGKSLDSFKCTLGKYHKNTIITQKNIDFYQIADGRLNGTICNLTKGSKTRYE